MDLFGDLPEPERTPRPSAGKEAQKGSLLFDDLPPASSTDSGSGGPLLFDDLPPAGSGDPGSPATSISQVVKNEGKGAKRKSPEEEEEDGSEELVEKKVCKASSMIFGLKGYVAERKGEREEMQDAHVILNDITEECRPPSSLITRVSYFAVFDGHGGIRASKFAAQNLHQNLIRKFPKGDVISVEKTVKRCLLDTFKHTDEEFLKQASSQKPAWKDGSTATCVLAVDNILYIANLGDSRAILCRFNEESQKHAALSLSKEHNPTQYEERMRIQKAGGNVRYQGSQGVLGKPETSVEQSLRGPRSYQWWRVWTDCRRKMCASHKQSERPAQMDASLDASSAQDTSLILAFFVPMVTFVLLETRFHVAQAGPNSMWLKMTLSS